MIPMTTYYSPEPEKMKLFLERDYGLIARAINGEYDTWTPYLLGGTTEGVGTYTTQDGWYYLSTIMVDYWFTITWSAHTGTGDLYMKLPFKTFSAEGNIWTGNCMTSSVSFANASDTYVVPLATSDSYVCDFVSGRHAAASGNIQVQAAGTITGFLRYMAEVK